MIEGKKSAAGLNAAARLDAYQLVGGPVALSISCRSAMQTAAFYAVLWRLDREIPVSPLGKAAIAKAPLIMPVYDGSVRSGGAHELALSQMPSVRWLAHSSSHIVRRSRVAPDLGCS